MEQNFDGFIRTLYQFLVALNRYVPTEKIKELISVYKDLPMDQVCLRYFAMMRDHIDKVNSRDASIFDQPLLILPNNIDISAIWLKLSKKQKEKVWVYMKMLYTFCEIILTSDIPESENTEEPEPEPEPELKPKPEPESIQEEFTFNPYIGVGPSDGKYGINEMYSGPDQLPGNEKSLGMGSMAGLLGLDRMFNINELKEQLKNMSKEDIDSATKNLKDLLGTSVSENTNELISDMLSNITTELKNEQNTDGDPLDSIMRIAESVATKLQPKIEEKNINVHELLQSTKGLTNNLTDEAGNAIFQGASNPFNLVNQMMGNIANSGRDPNQMTEQDCINECSNMLRHMGMNVPKNIPHNIMHQIPPQYRQTQTQAQAQQPAIPQMPMNRKMRRRMKKIQKKRSNVHKNSQKTRKKKQSK